MWQVQVGSPHILIGEVRSGEEKKTTFFGVDRKTGSPLWEGVNPGDRWWIGIEGVFNDVVLFHGFANPELPIHKGIHAVDALTGTLLWSDPDVRFGWCTRGRIGGLALNAEQRLSRTLDLRSGAEMPVDSELVHSLPSALGDELAASYPRPFDMLQFSDAATRERMMGRIPAAARDSCAGIVAGERAILSFGLPAGKSFEILLLSVQCRSGEVEWEEVVLPNAPRQVTEPFFIQGGVLYAIARRTTLLAISL